MCTTSTTPLTPYQLHFTTLVAIIATTQCSPSKLIGETHFIAL